MLMRPSTHVCVRVCVCACVCEFPQEGYTGTVCGGRSRICAKRYVSPSRDWYSCCVAGVAVARWRLQGGHRIEGEEGLTVSVNVRRGATEEGRSREANGYMFECTLITGDTDSTESLLPVYPALRGDD
eukprot:GHVU01166132.1.p1 GENE.GHVU01166132.1~~GHVU01166132.1.p1  ORF type:complete len:128 (-),score=4.54 GHVU01166132.1:1194-1577(-)